jgi:hypothetical protein
MRTTRDVRASVALAGACALLIVPLLPHAAEGQAPSHAFGSGVHFQTFSFDEALGADAASLVLVPAAYSLPLGDRFGLELYGAWANGVVEKGGASFTLQGPVDTQIRASYQLSPWAVLTALANLPTGNSTHDAEEALVASVLSTDILGFREANWGTGGAVTAGFAAAHDAGSWGIGIGASYRLSTGFEPTEGIDLTFEPGDEIRLRLGVDRSVGESGKLTLGFTFQNFAEDQYDEANLFQAGNRFRIDASFGFRAGRSTWALYAVDVWRESGDAFLDLVDPEGTIFADNTLDTGSQNLLLVGVNGSVPLGATLRLRPSLDFRYQSREQEDGEGWIVGAGADLPVHLFGSFDLFPGAKVLMGSLQAPLGNSEGLWGAEVGFTLRWRNRGG